ncbi:TPA: 50S ribosomal protein L7/L12 [Patescibacteria group bacterium]|nr:MAG: 50S ribosomal protein L7/L12 [Parcubacteria group bacterium GW2011_GWF2_40_10]KKR48022.1 MAG: 50S ribosomal protein L7/L12 [Parcubacteria group bacterium GW2011_GWA2_40_143]KKR60502.1 MAG: 50S ribosomal protein L7/L12 [Parcubacteria group bacterium GW2011_GWC2_40_31]KKR76140.1 MAG: 50S ribosomal protein L7/L12 [Parcubacteria group bacterium GW2011_GWE2_40_8]KKR81694.1 MAG: 50S ribosomal protein L7/L12 [Parcubacteria group bacterium GW2011_GWD2_40_9]HBB56763.1 50S ribosomal protein L7/L
MTEEKKVVEVPAKFKDIVEKIETMSVLDLSELVKLFEEKFGVSAQAVAVAAAPVAGGDAEGGDAVGPSKASVELKSAGDQKIQIIKVLREALGLGLKEAKDMADKAPVMVKEGVDKKEAEELKAKLEAAGGTVALK